MPTPEIEEFAKILIKEVRDESIEKCDMYLRPDVKDSVADRWRNKFDSGSSRALAEEMIPDCVDETIANLLQAIDSGLLRISFLASSGKLVDLTDEGEGGGEMTGWYMGGGDDNWKSKYSQQRFAYDFEDMDHFFDGWTEEDWKKWKEED